MSSPLAVQWPDAYKSETHPVHVSNHLDMAAPPDRVWAWLVRAPLWPEWYENSHRVKIVEGSGPDLVKETQFTWTTFNLWIKSTVLEYIPGERIGWDAHAPGFKAYHGWVLSPSAKGCYVLTEESQHGPLARLHKVLAPDRMYEKHQMWLECLEAKARGGFPPP